MASRTVTYGGGVSLDGFLAASDGGLDWPLVLFSAKESIYKALEPE